MLLPISNSTGLVQKKMKKLTLLPNDTPYYTVDFLTCCKYDTRLGREEGEESIVDSQVFVMNQATGSHMDFRAEKPYVPRKSYHVLRLH